MSIKVMSSVWEIEGLTAGEKLVLLCLADFANDEGKAWPSVARVAEKCDLSDRGVRKILRGLEQKGFLQTEENGGRKGCNNYLITPEQSSPPEHSSPGTEFPAPLNRVPQTPEQSSPEPSGTVKEPPISVPTFPSFWEQWPLGKVQRAKAETAFKRLSAEHKREAVGNARSWALRWREQNPDLNDIHPTTYLNGKRWQDEVPTRTPSQQNKFLKRVVGGAT